jgi:hypothetical protein
MAVIIAVIAAFLVGCFSGCLVGCGAQKKQPATVRIDTVTIDKIVEVNSKPRLVDSIPYNSAHNTMPQLVRKYTSHETGLGRSASGGGTGFVQQEITPLDSPTQSAPHTPAYVFADTFRTEDLTVATLDTVADNKIMGRKWWTDNKQTVITKTIPQEKKLPLFSLFGGGHATNLPAGTFYGVDAAVSIRGNAFIYGNYTFTQNSQQYGVLLKIK